MKLIDKLNKVLTEDTAAFEYNLLCPVQVETIIDENEIGSWGYEDWLKQKDEEGFEVAGEVLADAKADMESDIGTGGEEDEDDESIRSSESADFDEYFEEWLVQQSRFSSKNWGDSWSKFIDEFKETLSFGDVDEELFTQLQEDFNDSELEKYVHDDDSNIYGKIKSIRVIGHDGYNIKVRVKASEKLSPEGIEELKNYLEGQFSDGWGEGFEQREIRVDGKEYSVHTWWSEYPGMKVVGDEIITDLELVGESLEKKIARLLKEDLATLPSLDIRKSASDTADEVDVEMEPIEESILKGVDDHWVSEMSTMLGNFLADPQIFKKCLALAQKEGWAKKIKDPEALLGQLGELEQFLNDKLNEDDI